MDLFDYRGCTYLITVDYYPRWIEIKRLKTQTAEKVVTASKELYATYEIPDIVISDNGPYFSAESLQEFTASYGFVHLTSSPRYPQANEEVERAVRTAKKLLKTPTLQNGLSPSELLMGRRLQTQLPSSQRSTHMA